MQIINRLQWTRTACAWCPHTHDSKEQATFSYLWFDFKRSLILHVLAVQLVALSVRHKISGSLSSNHTRGLQSSGASFEGNVLVFHGSVSANEDVLPSGGVALRGL